MPYAEVAALDARAGRERWRCDLEVWRIGQASNGTDFVHFWMAISPRCAPAANVHDTLCAPATVTVLAAGFTRRTPL